jgi:hypothetical protein
MVDKPTEVQSKTPASPPVSDHVMAAAQQEYIARQTPAVAVATLDNTQAVKAMFPGDEAKQNAAYRIMMHDMKVDGYPKIDEKDAKLFTPEERQAIDKYVKNYKPSEDLAKVDAEAKELEKLGFPRSPI